MEERGRQQLDGPGPRLPLLHHQGRGTVGCNYTRFLLFSYSFLENLGSRTAAPLVVLLELSVLVGLNFCVISFNFFPLVKPLFKYLWILAVFDVSREVIPVIGKPLTIKL